MSLDDKLRELVSQITTGGHYERLNPQSQQLVESQVAQIKQAFADEGYLQKATPENVSYPFSVMLSGQEWYDRFTEQLQGEVFFNKDDDITVIGNILLKVDEAAKKASGL